MKYYDSWDGEHDEETKKLKHYNGVHWYPRIAVYDAKFGWTIDQHLVKNFMEILEHLMLTCFHPIT